MSYSYDYSGDMFGQQEHGQESQQAQLEQQHQQQHPTAAFAQWETLDPHQQQQQQALHSPLDTPVSGMLPIPEEHMPHSSGSSMPPLPSPIDNTPILLHHPHDNPPQQQRHAPVTTPAAMHPIDALIFGGSNRPPSAASVASSPGPSGTTGGVVRNPPRARTASATAGASHPYYRSHTATTSGGGGAMMTPTPPSLVEPSAPSAAGVGSGAVTGRRGSAVMTRSKTRKLSATMATGLGTIMERPMTRSTTSAAAASAAAVVASTSGIPSPTVRQSLFAPPLSSPHFVPQDVSSPGTPQAPPQQYQRRTSTTTATPPAYTTTTPAVPTTTQAQAQASTSSQIQTQAQVADTTRTKHRQRHIHTIPSDMHYSLSTHTLSCSLELPGVLPDNIRVSLSTCFFNHVKYVSVSAENVPPFPDPVWGEDVLRGLRGERAWGVVGTSAGAGVGEGGGESERLKIGRIVNPNLRERRFGIMRRLIQVPHYTRTQDISATLKNGVLTLTIDCGKPFEEDDEQEVPVSVQ